MRATVTVEFHELIRFAEELGFSEPDAFALLEGFRPEYEVSSIHVDLEMLQHEADEGLYYDSNLDLADMLLIVEAFCDTHHMEEFTVVP